VGHFKWVERTCLGTWGVKRGGAFTWRGRSSGKLWYIMRLLASFPGHCRHRGEVTVAVGRWPSPWGGDRRRGEVTVAVGRWPSPWGGAHRGEVLTVGRCSFYFAYFKRSKTCGGNGWYKAMWLMWVIMSQLSVVGGQCPNSV